MRRSFLFVAVAVALVLLGSPAAIGGPVQAPVATYEVTDLGLGVANAVNERGEVVGVVGQLDSGGGHAFVWQPTVGLTDLHVAAGWPVDARSGAGWINKHGEIVASVGRWEWSGSGNYFLEWNRHTGVVGDVTFINNEGISDINNKRQVVGGEMGSAYLWSLKDGRVALVDDGVADAVKVNDRGQVLGVTSGAFVPEYPNGLHYVIRETDGGLTHVAFFEMGPPPAWAPMLGDINNRGQVVYWAQNTTTNQVIGYLWDPKGGTIEYEGIRLMAINDHGLMAGEVRSSSGIYVPVLFDGEQVVQLPAPVGWSGSGRGWVSDVNNHGVAVGYLYGPDGPHAVVWTPSKVPASAPTTVLVDTFELYPAGSYPDAGGWYPYWSGKSAWVSADRAHGGEQSFRLAGYGGWVRTDAFDLDLSGVDTLTYRVAVNCSSEDLAGAEVGFLVRTASNESWMFNSMMFKNSHDIYVKGDDLDGDASPARFEYDTGEDWEYDTWYVVEARIDYRDLTISFWLDGQQLTTEVGADLVAAPPERSAVFALATGYDLDGVTYFDDVEITVEMSAPNLDSETQRPVPRTGRLAG